MAAPSSEWSYLALEQINSDVGLQVLSYGFAMTGAVIASTCAGIGSAVIVVIVVEVLHAISHVIDDSMTAILTVVMVQELTISPLNTFILRRHTCWPLVAVSGALWMGAEAFGYEVMDRTDIAVLKRLLGVCLVLVLVLNHVLPLVRLHCKGVLGGVKEDKMSPKVADSKMTATRSKMRLTPLSLGKSEAEETQMDDGKVDLDGCLSEAEAQQEVSMKSISTVPTQCTEFALRTRREWMLAIFLGLGGGFLRGLCGAPILVLVSFVLWSGIPKDQWRSSAPALTFVGLPMRIYYFFVVKERFDPARWPQIFGALLGCVVGILVGHSLSSKVNQADFLDFINFVVVVGAMLLLTNGFEASIPLAIATALCWLVSFAVVRVRRRVRGSEPEHSSIPSDDKIGDKA
mmetsp:Transcript_56301/g.104134  ORF Transcript_56301/g.104134 Transcript_56301/m.104134 type:complete len:403 (-) Transcript_56301:103-1311(-)